MGWWDTSIMGGDQPRDIESCFEDRFAEPRESMFDDVVIRPISAEDGLAFMREQVARDDDPVTRQVVGFLLIKNGAPMLPETRALVLEGIDTEINAERDWHDPAKRNAALSDFAAIVEKYPVEGGRVDLPEQPSLFDKIFGAA